MEADRLGPDILKEEIEKATQQLKNGKLEGLYGTVPLKSKLPVASRFRRDANRVARESSKRKMSGIN